MPSETQRLSLRLLTTALIASVGGLLFGFATTVVASIPASLTVSLEAMEARLHADARGG